MLQDSRLRTFCQVARLGNFTRAAQFLNMTQPAVTLQIKSLEQDLGIALFDRTGKAISLTAAGQILLASAEEMERISKACVQEINNLKAELCGELTVACSTTLGQYVLPVVFGRFARANPLVRLKLRLGNTEEVAQLVEARLADLGLVEGSLHRRSLKTELYAEDEIVLITPAQGEFHEPGPDRACACAGGLWSLEALKAVPLILRESGSGTRSVVEKYLESWGVSLLELNVLMELASTEAIKASVEEGLGVAFVSIAALNKEAAGKELSVARLERGAIRREFQFVYLREGGRAPLTNSFMRFARAKSP